MQARAHSGLARSYHATGEYAEASCHRQQALALYKELGTPEAHDICHASLGATPH